MPRPSLPKAPKVTVDCFDGSLPRRLDGYSIVAVDVIRATTTAITAVACGRTCYPVVSMAHARLLETALPGAVLLGEEGGSVPSGFHFDNSPAYVHRTADDPRPIILLSSSGTKLMCHKTDSLPQLHHVACLRNYQAQIDYLLDRPQDVALVGAASLGEFRPEDQLCCSWMLAGLIAGGYEPDAASLDFLAQWTGATLGVILESASARFLLEAGRHEDLDFVLDHVDDLPFACMLLGGRLVTTGSPPLRLRTTPPVTSPSRTGVALG